MKKRILLSPLLIIVLVVVFGIGVAGAAIFIGGSGETEEVNLQKGLIGHWKFDGDAKDSVSNNHGTVYGATLTTDRKGQLNKAYKFNDNLETLNMNYRVWKDGQTGAIGNFSTYGTVNSRILADDPWGRKVVIWRSGQTGGIYHSAQAIDNTKLYRMSWWEKRVTNAAATYSRYYAGLNGYGTTNGVYYRSDGTTLTTNPYFYSSSAVPTASQVPVGTWILVVGHVWPAGSGAGDMHVDSGRWNLDGSKLGNNTRDYIWDVSTTTGRSRTLAVYTGDDPDIVHYTVYPRLDVVDGTEPSLQDLLDGHDTYGNDIEINLPETPESISFWYKESAESSWTHVASSSGTFYVNGQLGTPTYNPVTIDSGKLYVGRTTMSDFFAGSIDDVRAYNRALSSAEITALYHEYDSSVQISDLQKGLMGNWKMNGDAKDATPNRNHGTVTGATLTTDRKDQINKAYNFDGNNDYVNTGTGVSLNLTGDVTVEAWVKSTKNDASLYQGIAGKANLSGTELGWILSKRTDNKFYFQVARSGVYSRNDTSTYSNVAYTDNSWHHLTGVILANGNHYIYVDGILQTAAYTSAVTWTPALSSIPLVIGTAYGDLPLNLTYLERFGGSIDNVRVYNRALSATEVSDLYNEYDPGIVVSDLQKGLVGNWRFDGYAKDSTPNRNHGTVTGATLTTDRKGQANKAYSFNGTSDHILAGNVGSSIKTISFWMQANTTSSKKVIDIDGTKQIELDGNSNVVATSFPSATIYIDGSSASVNIPNTSWHLVTITDSTGVSASTFDIGAVSSSYFDGKIDDVRIYNRALSQTEATALYENY